MMRRLSTSISRPLLTPAAAKTCITPGNDHIGMRVDRFILSSSGLVLRDSQERPTHSLLHRWARTKLISIARAPGHPTVPSRDLLSHRISAGDELMIDGRTACDRIDANQHQADNERAAHAAPPPPPWLNRASLLHVSPHFVVLNKPAGIPAQVCRNAPGVHVSYKTLCLTQLKGGTGILEGSSIDAALPAIAALADELQPVFMHSSRFASTHPSTSSMLRLVHRLDRDVSGVLVLARTRVAAAELSAAFASGSAHAVALTPSEGAGVSSKDAATTDANCDAASSLRKTYVAVVAAALPPHVPLSGRIAAPVVSLDTSNRAMRETQDAEAMPVASAAATDYSARVFRLKRAPGADATTLPAAITVLHMQPLTGRKHQLRQHVLHLFQGCAAILGDAKYTPIQALQPCARCVSGYRCTSSSCAPPVTRELVISDGASDGRPLPPRPHRRAERAVAQTSRDVDATTLATSPAIDYSVHSRPAPVALRSRGLSPALASAIGLPSWAQCHGSDVPVAARDASRAQARCAGSVKCGEPPAAATAWLCRHLMLHSLKMELGAKLAARLVRGGSGAVLPQGETRGTGGGQKISPLTVRAPLPLHMRALLDCYEET